MRRIEFAAALLLELIGAAGALLISGRTWQSVLTPRPLPLPDDLLHVSGRTLDTAPTALALVALAGVVAVLATRGWVRRGVGAVIALAGAALVWRSWVGAAAVSAARARALVIEQHPQVNTSASTVEQVSTHAQWPVLSALCGVLIVVAGAVIAWRGARWAAMSAKYDAPSRQGAAPDDQAARAREHASLWRALDHGDDPTQSPPEH
jgi:uncharacterized membrane protein (TIGR02234 family)